MAIRRSKVSRRKRSTHEQALSGDLLLMSPVLTLVSRLMTVASRSAISSCFRKRCVSVFMMSAITRKITSAMMSALLTMASPNRGVVNRKSYETRYSTPKTAPNAPESVSMLTMTIPKMNTGNTTSVWTPRSENP